MPGDERDELRLSMSVKKQLTSKRFEKLYDPYCYERKKHKDLLHIAIRKDDINNIRFLLKYGIDLELKDDNGKTALDLAVDNQQTEVVYAILENNGFNRNLYSDRNKEKISKLRKIQKAYQFVQENDPVVQNNNPARFSSLNYEEKHLACCIAILQKKEDLLFEIDKIDSKIMSSNHNYGLAKEFSPNDLKLFLKNSSNTECLSGIKTLFYKCIGTEYKQAKDFAGLLDMIWPLKESEVLKKAGVEQPIIITMSRPAPPRAASPGAPEAAGSSRAAYSFAGGKSGPSTPRAGAPEVAAGSSRAEGLPITPARAASPEPGAAEGTQLGAEYLLTNDLPSQPCRYYEPVNTHAPNQLIERLFYYHAKDGKASGPHQAKSPVRIRTVSSAIDI